MAPCRERCQRCEAGPKSLIFTFQHPHPGRRVVDVSDLGRCESLRVLNLRCSGATVVPRRDDLTVEFDVPTLWVPITPGGVAVGLF